jgi:hypothetical protein
MVAVGHALAPKQWLLLLALTVGLSACSSGHDDYSRELRYVDGCGDCSPCCGVRGPTSEVAHPAPQPIYVRPPVQRNYSVPPPRPPVQRVYYAPPPRDVRRYAEPVYRREAPIACDQSYVRQPVAPCGGTVKTRHREIDTAYYGGGNDGRYADYSQPQRPAHYSARRLYGSGRCCE